MMAIQILQSVAHLLILFTNLQGRVNLKHEYFADLIYEFTSLLSPIIG